MRRVAYSKSFADQLIEQIDYGEQQSGTRVAFQKKELVLTTIERPLANTPVIKQPRPRLGLRLYPVWRRPCVVLYDLGDTQLRIHVLVHRNASLDDLDPGSAEW